MTDTRQTYEIAAPQIKAYVQPLWPGALAMPFELRDEDGRRLNLADDHLSGRYLLLAFLNDVDDEQARVVLDAIGRRRDALDALNAAVVAVNSDSDAMHNRRLRENTAFRWPVTGDATGAVFASYGLHKDNDVPVRLVAVTPMRQVRVWFDDPDDIDTTMAEIMDVMEKSDANEELRWGPPHAPVLVVPNVLTPEECGNLIRSFEEGVPFMVRPPRAGEISSDYQIPVYEHSRQDRVDQIIQDRDTLQLLDERIFGRVTPMIKKAFAFDATRRENLHIARYVGKRGGNPMGHRDNTSPSTAYRRFALSMALNDDYEGGEIAFREFSPKGYRLPPGAAMVFSSSLLHEIAETTKGVRYNLISHFYNDEATRP